MMAASRLQGALFVTIEAQADSVRHFRALDALAEDERFDLVLGSSPDFPVGAASRAVIRRKWRAASSCAETSATTPAWLRLISPLRSVFPKDQCARLERAAEAAGLVVIRRRPVVFREGEPPLIEPFAMMRAADLRLSIRSRTRVEPPLIVRTADGEVHPEYATVKLSVWVPP